MWSFNTVTLAMCLRLLMKAINRPAFVSEDVSNVMNNHRGKVFSCCTMVKCVL